jgi:hypothetical protein
MLSPSTIEASIVKCKSQSTPQHYYSVYLFILSGKFVMLEVTPPPRGVRSIKSERKRREKGKKEEKGEKLVGKGRKVVLPLRNKQVD